MGIKGDLERLTKEAAENDKQLKENLKTFESSALIRRSCALKRRTRSRWLRPAGKPAAGRQDDRSTIRSSTDL